MRKSGKFLGNAKSDFEGKRDYRGIVNNRRATAIPVPPDG
jgi:hypothetical protein